ncbi:YHS domain-containing (seleno)protein [Hoeflea poritis]|uniref:Tat pathway signal sequence domain protein n=1 Tax=Hoeflea poritis TaxID=2993659 RepID=A0ABT4VUU6_9HYPH|nr:YHS domain-containing (seleno)protein [Hoeflea poritis]MDA4848487.1 tat pathway signal sequence domain protein [Hoeflea poritis]
MRRKLHIAIAAFLFLALQPAVALSQEIFTRGGSALALEGFDAVSYFASGKPVAGDPNIVSNYKGVAWRFANARNKAAFDANPRKYAPQYGGHCAWGTARGYAVRGDPKVWRIVGGKLYLNYNRSVQSKWNRDIPGFISQGDRNWPAVLKTKK